MRKVYAIAAALLLAGCGKSEAGKSSSGASSETAASTAETTAENTSADENTTALETESGDDDAPLSALDVMERYNTAEKNVLPGKYGSTYEIFVYSFCDSDGDGIGDLQGIISKLDYIQETGFDGIWLTPICPSDSYHKYDVKDYYAIDPIFGTMDDFEQLAAECDKRGIRLITDLVINHTSSSHEWFREAASYLKSLPEGAEPDTAECPYVAYYNFTRELKGSNYHQLAGTDWYYDSPFWSEMPDLDLQEPSVRSEIEKIVDFWVDKGVDGFRLDAAKEYVSGNDIANTEILSWFASYVHSKDEDLYLVAEVWMDMQGYLPYYASGVDSIFDFTFADTSGKIATALKKTNAMTYGNALLELQQGLGAYENAVDAPFYTNHDMGRSAGYYPGETKESKIKLAQAMNLFMTGNAFLYYGEELGLKGSGDDENKRSPMLWYSDASAAGMCKGPDGMDRSIEQIYPALDVQEKNGNSIYNYICQALKLRNAYPQIRQGETEVLPDISDSNACVIKKTYDGRSIFVIFNVSDREVTVNMAGTGAAGIAGCLVTDASAPEMNGESVTVPAFGVIVLK